MSIKGEEEFTKRQELANKAYSNEGIWKRELLNKIKKIKDRVRRYGPDALDSKKIGTLFDASDPSMNNSIRMASVKSHQQFQQEYDALNEQMEGLGHRLPRLDQNFYQNISNFSKSSKQYFRKKLVDQCVRGNRYRGLALNWRKILKGLKQSNTTTRGTNVINYRNQLQKIIDQESLFEDKMAAIRKLDKSYGGTIVYRYRDTKAGLVSRPPSEIFKATIRACTRKIVQDNPTGQNNSAQNIVQIERRINDLSKKARTFTNDMAKDIYDRVANCDGRTLQAGACHAKGPVMKPEESGFCIAHAASCANAIRSCHKQVNDKILMRTNSIKTLGKQWDDSVKTFVQKQQNYLSNYLFPPVASIMEQIRKHLPSATIQYDAETFIESPLPEKSNFDISMLAGGETEGLEQLPNRIETNLIGMLEKQKKKLNNAYDEYIQNKKTSIDNELRRWRELRKDCEKIESKLAKNAEKTNQKRQAQFKQARQEAEQFCAKYALLRKNPNAGCEGGENSVNTLYTQYFTIQKHIDPNAARELNRFMEHCNQYNNERTPGTEDDDKPDSLLNQYCEDNDNNYEGVKDKILEMALKTVPEDHHDNARDYLTKPLREPNLIKELASPLRGQLVRVRRLFHPNENDDKIMDHILEDMLSNDIKTREEVIEYFNKEKKPLAKNILSSPTGQLSLEELSKLSKSANPKIVKSLFNNADKLKKIQRKLKHLVSMKKDLKTGKTDNLCIKHTNYAIYRAAENCDGIKEEDCPKGELRCNQDIPVP